MKCWYFYEFFFWWNELTLWGKKRAAHIQTHNWEKSSLFNSLVHGFAQLYANTWQGGRGVNRVNFDKGTASPAFDSFFRPLIAADSFDCNRHLRPLSPNWISLRALLRCLRFYIFWHQSIIDNFFKCHLASTWFLKLFLLLLYCVADFPVVSC